MVQQTRVKVSAIQTPSPANTLIVQRQMKESIEVAQRLRGDPNDSFVKVSELAKIGVIQLAGTAVVAPTAGPAASGAVPAGRKINTADSIQGGGTLAADLTLQLVGDAATPGNTMLYGTNVSGVKGWYAQPTAPVITETRGAAFVGSSNAAVALPVNNVTIVFEKTVNIVRATIVTTGGVGSCTVDIWKSSVGTAPTIAGTICGGTPPAIASGISYDNSTLAGWTTAVSPGNTLTFVLTATTIFTSVVVQLTTTG